jgi:hypothetical protein
MLYTMAVFRHKIVYRARFIAVLSIKGDKQLKLVLNGSNIQSLQKTLRGQVGPIGTFSSH